MAWFLWVLGELLLLLPIFQASGFLNLIFCTFDFGEDPKINELLPNVPTPGHEVLPGSSLLEVLRCLSFVGLLPSFFTFTISIPSNVVLWIPPPLNYFGVRCYCRQTIHYWDAMGDEYQLAGARLVPLMVGFRFGDSVLWISFQQTFWFRYQECANSHQYTIQ